LNGTADGASQNASLENTGPENISTTGNWKVENVRLDRVVQDEYEKPGVI